MMQHQKMLHDSPFMFSSPTFLIVFHFFFGLQDRSEIMMPNSEIIYEYGVMEQSMG